MYTYIVHGATPYSIHSSITQIPPESCVLDVQQHDTVVRWNNIERLTGKYNLYKDDYITVSIY